MASVDFALAGVFLCIRQASVSDPFGSLANTSATGEMFDSFFFGIFGKDNLSEFSEELKLKSERKEERPLAFCLHRIDG